MNQTPARSNPCRRLIDSIDYFSELTGRGVAWLTLAMVLLTFLIVILRYGFDSGSIALQESVTWLHATVFMLGASYALKRDSHVRVDIFYQKFSPRGRALVDLLGSLLLLLPVCLFIFLASWDYVLEAWKIGESSAETGGLPGLYLLKSLLLIMPSLLILQALAHSLRAWLILRGDK
ncbi:TRAP dicarboxylate transporter, DctQ subunit, unknown substrate 6 [hydrothermal vent metagenome]|uniref:Tripartite ATP-independent periplasmic transporters DctQ component domain-containing protein n=1 Tax=hydrothermal vent metagenome TaxID=652676 RepID=A0A3B1CBU7_9ZZZZ